MQHNFIWIPISLLGLLVFSSALIVPVRAAIYGWVGNDDGEFGLSSPADKLYNGYGRVEAFLDSPMTYTSPNGEVSLQYNPDLQISKSLQTKKDGGADWFQTGIIGQSSSSGYIFTVQVWNTLWRDSDYFWCTNNCNPQSNSGIFGSGAVWMIIEYTDSSGKVNQILFEFAGSAGYNYLTFSPPVNWYWLISNVCWCGVNTNTATFTGSTSGHLYYDTSVIMNAFVPPGQIGTAENSNIGYSCFSGSGTKSMSQTFSFTHC